MTLGPTLMKCLGCGIRHPAPACPTKKVFEVFLENPVSVNHQFFQKSVISKKSGKNVIIRIPTQEAKDFKTYCGAMFLNVPRYEGYRKIIIEVTAIWPDKRKRDVTNFAKAVVDAFKESGHVPDDNIVLWREMDWFIEKGVYGLKLKIYESEIPV